MARQEQDKKGEKKKRRRDIEVAPFFCMLFILFFHHRPSVRVFSSLLRPTQAYSRVRLSVSLWLARLRDEKKYY